MSGGRQANQRLEKLLHTHTPTETWHIDHPNQPSPRYKDVPTVDVNGHRCLLFDWQGTLRENPVGLIKETRFTDVPPHVNRDMELSMVYEGSCDFIVGDHRHTLHPGDVIIFDTDVERSSPSCKGEDDIVLSMVFRRQFFDTVFLSQLPGASLLTSLVLESISDRRNHDRYLVVPAQHAGRSTLLMEILFEEYYFSGFYSAELIRSYVTCLFLELIRGLYRVSPVTENQTPDAETVIRVLAYVEQNHALCTLASTAKHFGYSASYLGTLLRQETGKTFSEIKLAQQMSEAVLLLLNTSRPISEVAHAVGITNMTYFYRKFQERFSMTPKEFRQQVPADSTFAVSQIEERPQTISALGRSAPRLKVRPSSHDAADTSH